MGISVSRCHIRRNLIWSKFAIKTPNFLKHINLNIYIGLRCLYAFKLTMSRYLDLAFPKNTNFFMSDPVIETLNNLSQVIKNLSERLAVLETEVIELRKNHPVFSPESSIQDTQAYSHLRGLGIDL